VYDRLKENVLKLQ